VKIAVYGLGHLGLPLASVFVQAGFEVIGIDRDAERIERIRDRRAPCSYEPGVNPTGLAVTTTPQPADMSFVVVPTPSLDSGDHRGGFDPSYVEAALRQIDNVNDTDHIAVIVSTLSPGTCDDLAKKFHRLDLVYNPTFIALGQVVKGLTEPDLLLIGSRTEDADQVVLAVWATVFDHFAEEGRVQVHVADSYTEIELIKLSVNAALGTKISLANSLGMLFEAYGVDPIAVEVVGRDPRIGTAYFTPGSPITGPCLPRDNRALWRAGFERELPMLLAQAVDSENELVYAWLIKKIIDHAPRTVGILGMTYKYGVDVDTDAVGPLLVKNLEVRGIEVATYDEVQGGDLSKVVRCDVVVVTQREYHEMAQRIDGEVIDLWAT
jgi:nucleotide sugar dehydrogenase